MKQDFIITGIRSVIHVGPEKYAEKSTQFRKNLTSHELIYHFSGEATVYFDDQVLVTGPNTIRFLPQGNVSRYEVERKKPGSCVDVFFCTDRPISDEAFTMHVLDGDGLAALFKRLFALWVSKEQGYRFACMSLLYRIFSLMQKNKCNAKNTFSCIDPAVQYIHDHFLDELPEVQFLAEQCGISYSYMKKLFVRRFGLSPKQYMIQLRMNHACDLLRTGAYTVTSTAGLCGFQDVYHFSHQFKRYMGCSPSEFARK